MVGKQIVTTLVMLVVQFNGKWYHYLNYCFPDEIARLLLIQREASC